MIRWTPILLVLVAACSPGFDEPWEILDQRLIGITADPPEFVFPVPPEALAAMESGRTPEGPPLVLSALPALPVQLSLLIVGPDGAPGPFEYEASGCVLDGADCRQDLPIVKLATGGADSSLLVLDIELPPDLVVASLENEIGGGVFGAAIWVKGEIKGEGWEAPFLKAVLVTPDFVGDRAANANPRISRLLEGEREKETPVQTDQEGVVVFARDQEYRLLPDIPEEDRETFTVITFDTDFSALVAGTDPAELLASAQLEEITEQLSVRFFANCGNFSASSKTEEPNPVFETAEEAEAKTLSVRWTSPADPEECKLWFVVDDGRAGAGWFEIAVRVD